MKLRDHIKLADWLREKRPELLGLKNSEIADIFAAEFGISCAHGHVYRMAKDLGLDFTPPPKDSIEQLRKDLQILSGIMLDSMHTLTSEDTYNLQRIFKGEKDAQC